MKLVLILLFVAISLTTVDAACKKCRAGMKNHANVNGDEDRLSAGNADEKNGQHNPSHVIQPSDRPKNDESSSEEEKATTVATTTALATRIRRSNGEHDKETDELLTKDSCNDYLNHAHGRDIYRELSSAAGSRTKRSPRGESQRQAERALDKAIFSGPDEIQTEDSNVVRRRERRSHYYENQIQTSKYFEPTMSGSEESAKSGDIWIPADVDVKAYLEEQIQAKRDSRIGYLPGRGGRGPVGLFPDLIIGGHHHHHNQPHQSEPAALDGWPIEPRDFLNNRHFSLEEGVRRQLTAAAAHRKTHNENDNNKKRVPRAVDSDKSSVMTPDNDLDDNDDLIRRKLQSGPQEKKLQHERRQQLIKPNGNHQSDSNLKLSKDQIFYKIQNDLNRSGRAGDNQGPREKRETDVKLHLDDGIRHKLQNNLNRSIRAGDDPSLREKHDEEPQLNDYVRHKLANDQNRSGRAGGQPAVQLNDWVQQKLDQDREKWKLRGEQLVQA